MILTISGIALIVGAALLAIGCHTDTEGAIGFGVLLCMLSIVFGYFMLGVGVAVQQKDTGRVVPVEFTSIGAAYQLSTGYRSFITEYQEVEALRSGRAVLHEVETLNSYGGKLYTDAKVVPISN